MLKQFMKDKKMPQDKDCPNPKDVKIDKTFKEKITQFENSLNELNMILKDKRI